MSLDWVHNNIGTWVSKVRVCGVLSLYLEIVRINMRYRLTVTFENNHILYEEMFSTMTSAKHAAPDVISNCLEAIIKDCCKLQRSLTKNL